MHAQKQNTDKTHKNTRTTVCAHTDSCSHSYNHARTHAQQPSTTRERESKRNNLAHFVHLQRTQIVTAQGGVSETRPNPKQSAVTGRCLPSLAGSLALFRVLTLALSPNFAASFGHALHLLQFAFAAAAAVAVVQSVLPEIPFIIDY